jgi:hypothetical protein
MRPDTIPHDGHAARDVRVVAWTRTDPPERNTRSIHTQARCGKKIVSNSETVTDHDHQARQANRVKITEFVPEPGFERR